MKKMIAVTALITAALVTSGCATKRYPIATPLSLAEASALDCNGLRLEIIRGEQVQAQIADTSKTDWRSVAGFLGDYGIGNAMAKSEADRAVSARMISLRNAHSERKCDAPAGPIEAVRHFVEGLFN